MLVGFIQTPPILAPRPPVLPPGPSLPPGGALIGGGLGRLAMRNPGAALVIGAGLLIGWALLNWRQPPKQEPPQGGFPPGTDWDYRTGTSTSWMIRIRSLIPYASGPVWESVNAYAELNEAGILAPINIYMIGPRIVTVTGTSVRYHPAADVGYQLGVYLAIVDANGNNRSVVMASQYSKTHKIEIYPISDSGQPGGTPGTPLIPAPYLPPAIDPDEADANRRKGPQPGGPALFVPSPGLNPKPTETKPTPTPADPQDPDRKKRPAAPPPAPGPARPPGRNPQLPGTRNPADSKPGTGGGGIKPAKTPAGGTETDKATGPENWTQTKPNGTPEPEPQQGPQKTTTTGHLTKAGMVDAPDARPDLPSIAAEVGRIERKVAGLQAGPGVDLGTLLRLLEMIYDLLTNKVGGITYGVEAACLVKGETKLRKSEVKVDGGLTREEAAIARLDALALLIANAQKLTQASCGGSTRQVPANNVTVTAYEVQS